ncbi:MAG: hypothetical protein HJJLKODD_00152 [Phycisphaerae bacterium]|nr:hypothetical protein [Phycisphaerae bacterium]
MSVNAACGKLKRASRDLLIRWRETELHWRDDNTRQFSEKVLQPLFAQVRKTEMLMAQMDVFLRKIRHDVI